MDKNKLKKLRDLVDTVMYSATKKDAKKPIERLEFMSMNIMRDLDSYLSEKLGEVVSYAKEASGQVENKGHWISCAENSWYIFESRVQKQQINDN